MVFDDRFSTVESIGLDDTPPSYWEELCLENTLYLPTHGTPDMPVHLNDDWLTKTERELKYRDLQRQERVRQIQHPTAPALKVFGRTKGDSPSLKDTEGDNATETTLTNSQPLAPAELETTLIADSPAESQYVSDVTLTTTPTEPLSGIR